MKQRVFVNDNNELQAQFLTENTIYVIEDDLYLNQSTIIVPRGSVLLFNGGTIRNGTIKSDDCLIESSLNRIFFDVRFEGDFVNGTLFEVEWFVSEYETTYIADSSKDASVELNQAFGSGVKKIRINNDRYFPVRNKIIVTGNIDIYGKTQHHDSSKDGVFYREPCIYSNTVLNVFEYIYNFTSGSNSQNTEIKNHVHIEGINIFVDFCNIVENNSFLSPLDFRSVFVLKTGGNRSNVCLWGIYLDIAITSKNVDDYELYTNNTGIEIFAENADISFVEIHGYLARMYRGIWCHAANNRWITDTKVYADTYCVEGGLFDGGYPTRVYGTHQTMASFGKYNNKAYFYGKKIFNYGYVWDLGVENGEYHSGPKLYSCRYVSAPLPDDALFSQYLQQPETQFLNLVELDDFACPNLLADSVEKYMDMGISVERNIVCTDCDGNEMPNEVERLNFVRYQFPARLTRWDDIYYNSLFRSDIGFCTNAKVDLNYSYELIITIERNNKICSYHDVLPLYFSPYVSSQAFGFRIDYYEKNGTSPLSTRKLAESESDAGYHGFVHRYCNLLKVDNLFETGDDNRSSYVADSKVVITFHQLITQKIVFAHPLFFIPDYHSTELVRSGYDQDMVNMTSFDVGQSFYHKLYGQLCWDGTKWLNNKNKPYNYQNYGTQRPVVGLTVGDTFFDTILNKSITWTGQKWIEADGASAGVRRFGPLGNTPSANDIYVGFEYLCTSSVLLKSQYISNFKIVFTGTNWVMCDGTIVK